MLYSLLSHNINSNNIVYQYDINTYTNQTNTIKVGEWHLFPSLVDRNP